MNKLTTEDIDLIYNTAVDMWRSKGYMCNPDRLSVEAGLEAWIFVTNVKKQLEEVRTNENLV
jgi:hypothetical protein